MNGPCMGKDPRQLNYKTIYFTYSVFFVFIRALVPHSRAKNKRNKGRKEKDAHISSNKVATI